MVIFPQPQSLKSSGETIALVDDGNLACSFVLAADADPLERAAADLLADEIATNSGVRPTIASSPGLGVPIYVGESARSAETLTSSTDLPDRPEAYTLLATASGIALLGSDPAGTYYAAHTLKQMMRREDDSVFVEATSITDWPDFRHRGLYIESKWGPDLMGLQDWRDLIDYLAGLKFNALGIGIYCCWGVQYEGKRTEFLMVPFPGHPELKTPKTIRYYSAKDEEWHALTYLPRMFEEDFFGEVVAYAKSRNITVRPHFNGPGHTTLIPTTHPEVAARDEAGNPEPYGYCLSNPQTYDLLFELWDSVIDRYLAPNGVDWFHMGLDEIWVSRGVDEDNPERVVDPWCKCADCRERTPNELLTEYVIKATQHLAAKGINNISIWNDHLSRFGLLDDGFVAKLTEAGVRDKVILQWWRYDEPVLEIPPDLGLRAWTTPMAGYYFWLFTQSYASNIYPHLALGYGAGAEGADAYCVFDPAFDRNYACLAEYGWNQTSSGDLYQFKSRYAERVMGVSGFDAIEPFEKWDQVYDTMPLVGSALDILLPYWHTYSRAREVYPRNVVQALLDDQLRSMRTYSRARTHLRRARGFFAARRDSAPDPGLIDEYLCECERLIAVVDAYDGILGGIRQSQDALAAPGPARMQEALAAASQTVKAGLQSLDGAMAFAEDVKKPYLQPQLLRDLSTLRAYVASLAATIERASESQESMGSLRQMLAEVAG